MTKMTPGDITEREILAVGFHAFSVFAIGEKHGAKGPYVEFQLQHESGRVLYDNRTLTGNPWALHEMLDALNVPEEGRDQLDFADGVSIVPLLGRDVLGLVWHDEYQGRTRDKISVVKSPQSDVEVVPSATTTDVKELEPVASDG
jgi:hypothetical protein